MHWLFMVQKCIFAQTSIAKTKSELIDAIKSIQKWMFFWQCAVVFLTLFVVSLESGHCVS